MNINLTPFIPELILAGGILLLVVLDLFLMTNRGIVTAIGGSLILLVVAIVALSAEQNGGEYLFGAAVQDGTAVFFRVLFAAATILSIAMLTFSFPNEAEPYLLMLSSVLGMMLLAGVNDVVSLFVALELVSIPSYVLAGYHRNDPKSAEAALKYVLFGALSSGLMIYGFSLLYGVTGTTNIPKMAEGLVNGHYAEGLVNGHYAEGLVNGHYAEMGMVTMTGLILVLAGIGYKVALVPMHFWCPDVYEGSPTPITAFFSVTPKAAGFAALFRLMPVFAAGMPVTGGAVTEGTLGASVNALPLTAVTLFTVVSAVTMTFGNLGAIWQTSLKRLLAYSSIAHAGYILMGFAAIAAFPAGETRDLAAMAVMFYLVVYLFMNLGAFFVVDYIERREGSDNFSVIKGWGKSHPLPALLLAVFLFSLTGLPPLAGFVGKFYLLAALVKGKLFALAIIAVLNTVVSLFYYIRIVRDMFLYDPEEGSVPATKSTPRLAVAIGLATLIPTLLWGVAFGGIAEWIEKMVR